MNKLEQKIIKLIQGGGVGVLPTDTLYGLVGKASSKKSVARIYALKKRTPQKPCIILINTPKDLKKFSVKLNLVDKKILAQVWPGKVSVVLPCSEKKFFFLHRGTKTLAFRLPENKKLRNILCKTGPLLAPSANPEGLRPALTVKEAKKYFGNQVDFYQAGGKLKSPPSTLISITGGKIKILRPGIGKIKKSH